MSPSIATLSIKLSTNTFARLTARAAQAGQSLEEFIAGLAETAAQEADRNDVPLSQRRVDERLEAWHRWCEGHAAADHDFDDSRESIYAERGE